MALSVKMQLIEDLDTTRCDLLALIEGVAADTVIHADSGWQLKDILYHIAVGEQESAHSLRAFLDGGSYEIPGYTNDDDFNAAVFQQHHADPFADIYAVFVAARAEFKTAVAATPLEKFESQMRHPWRYNGTVIDLIRSVIDHEREHTEQIRRVLPPRA